MTDPALPPQLGDLLEPVSRRLGMTDARAVGRLFHRWREVVGDQIAAHAEPTSLRAGVLRIRVDSPVWATELSYLGPEIARRANEALGVRAVAEVRLWTGPGRPQEPERARPDGRPDGPSAPPEDPAVALQDARRAWLRDSLSQARENRERSS